MVTKSSTYEEYRKVQLEDGRLFQDFCADLLYANGYPVVVYSSKTYQLNAGESRGGWEFKHDKLRQKTGNLYIEVGEKARPRDGDYFPSGIYARHDTVFYVIGDYDRVYLFANNILILLHRSGRFRDIPNNGTNTSTGFLLPEEDADKYAAAVFVPELGSVIKRTVEEIERAAHDLYRRLSPQAADFSLELPFDQTT